jgi:hypothetical protein
MLLNPNSLRYEQLARQNLGAGSEQELVQIAGVTPYAQPAGASNGPLSHLHASAVTEPHAVKLDAEALARSLPSDNPESSRRVSFSNLQPTSWICSVG